MLRQIIQSNDITFFLPLETQALGNSFISKTLGIIFRTNLKVRFSDKKAIHSSL